MGPALVIWNQPNASPLRQVDWASVPLDVSGKLLTRLFRDLPKGSHVDLVFEKAEVREAVKACADISVQEWYRQVYGQLESWRQLMDTWKRQGSYLTVGEFGDG